MMKVTVTLKVCKVNFVYCSLLIIFAELPGLETDKKEGEEEEKKEAPKEQVD
jgi:hypothetical protein